MSRPNKAAQQVASELRAFAAAQDELDQAAAAAGGLDTTELHAMEVVSRAGGSTPGELARRLSLTTGAVTGLIDRLERRGFLTREPDPKDRRRVIVRLGADGEKWERRTFGPFAREWQGLLGRADEHELAVVLGFLRRTRGVAETHAARLRRPRSSRGATNV